MIDGAILLQKNSSTETKLPVASFLMWRIHILALFVSISSVAYFRHGASAKESHPSGTRSAWRRRKTPFESIQVEGGSTISIRVSSSVLDIGSRANNGFGKLFAEKDKGQSVQISVENGNHGITKNQLREYINKQGDSNEKDVNHRESPMVQQINENIKKQEEITMAEAPALMKMMLLSDSDYGMSMSMPPAVSLMFLSVDAFIDS